MAPCVDLWLCATIRVLLRRVSQLERRTGPPGVHTQPFAWNLHAPDLHPISRPPGVHLPPTSFSNAEFANFENDQNAVNSTEFPHDNSPLTLQEVNALDEEDRNAFFEDCLPEHFRPPDCFDLDLDDEPDEFENDTTHNAPAFKKTVSFMETDEVCTFASSTPSFTPSSAPRISSSAPPSSFPPSTPPSSSSSSARAATVSRQLIRKGKDMNGHDDIDESAAFREPPKGKKKKKKKEIKRLIMEIYAKHNPQKLVDVDKLMDQYECRELELLQAIRDKYA